MDMPFVPSAESALPVYEVSKRVYNDANDTYEIIVEDNGFYPWTYSGSPADWPVWVIPPAIEATENGNPVFSNQSPILAVGRRFIRLHEAKY